MFNALSRIGRQQALQGRRTLEECERWEYAIQQLVMPVA